MPLKDQKRRTRPKQVILDMELTRTALTLMNKYGSSHEGWLLEEFSDGNVIKCKRYSGLDWTFFY